MKYTIELYSRPESSIREEIVEITKLLTGKWFTEGVPWDTERDLIYQDAMCLKVDGKIVSFIIFTSWDGSIHITLMGTHPDYRGKGLGSKLMKAFIKHVKDMGRDRIMLMTVPPDKKPAYKSTVEFYKKHGFIITRTFTEIWQNGAIEMVKDIK